MGKGTKAGVTLVWAAALLAGAAAPALAQQKELSEKSVLAIMRYAWSMVPDKFTSPQGKTILVDKSKASESIVPLDTAREVIRVARLSAQAQRCELAEELRANFQTLMRRQEASGKWSDQQMLYMNQLHLFVVMWLSGKVQLVEKDGDKQVSVQDGKATKTETCTDTERKKVSEHIMAYVNSAPSPATEPGATKRVEPTPTSQKK